MKQIQVYVLDLTKIGGSGDFSCPRCGNEISPDDPTEKAYSIMEAKASNQGLEELMHSLQQVRKQTSFDWFFSSTKTECELLIVKGGVK